MTKMVVLALASLRWWTSIHLPDRVTGNILRVDPKAPKQVVVGKIERTLPDGKTRQAIVANGLALDAKGVLHVADTARAAIWKIEVLIALGSRRILDIADRQAYLIA